MAAGFTGGTWPAPWQAPCQHPAPWHLTHAPHPTHRGPARHPPRNSPVAGRYSSPPCHTHLRHRCSEMGHHGACLAHAWRMGWVGGGGFLGEAGCEPLEPFDIRKAMTAEQQLPSLMAAAALSVGRMRPPDPARNSVVPMPEIDCAAVIQQKTRRSTFNPSVKGLQAEPTNSYCRAITDISQPEFVSEVHLPHSMVKFSGQGTGHTARTPWLRTGTAALAVQWSAT